jgi:hypothetical protein
MEKAKEITLQHLQNIYRRLSNKKKLSLLENILGESIWSNIALEMNYKIIKDYDKPRLDSQN